LEIYPPGFFLVADFRHLATIKRAGESNKGIFEDFSKKIAISQEKKLKSRQIWRVRSIRSPELGRIPKKIY